METLGIDPRSLASKLDQFLLQTNTKVTRNRFNQAKHQSTSTSTSTNNLTLSKACGLFLEDIDNIDMKDNYKITNVHPPLDGKDVVNEEYCDNNLLSSVNKIDISCRNITELRKVEFDKFTTKTLQLNETQVNDELINKLIESANEVTNTLSFAIKLLLILSLNIIN